MHTRANLLVLCALLSTPLANAANFDRATFTELVKDVTVLAPATKKQRTPQLRDIFTTPDVLRTGPESRAEMIADDQTVTRVGANSLFSFEPQKREINLQRGSVLFNSPSGKGGGTIKTAAATAAVLGTTMIVVTTKNGGFKVLLIEGRGKVTSTKGEARVLHAGQMVFVLPGEKMGPVYNFQLKEQVAASRLIGGFKRPLPSLPKIIAAVARQNSQIDKGALTKTGLLAGDNPNEAYQVDTVATESILNEEETPAEIFKLGNALIDSPDLDPNHIFAGGTGVAGNGTLFLALNTLIHTASIDLNAYPGESFEFISLNNLHFASSVKVDGDMPVYFLAGGTITNAPGTLVELNNSLTSFGALGGVLSEDLADNSGNAGQQDFNGSKPLRLVDFALINHGGDLDFFAPSIILNNAGLMAARNLDVHSDDSIHLFNNITALQTWSFAPAGVTDGSGGPPPILQADTSFSSFGTALEAGDRLRINAETDFSAFQTDFVAENTEIRAGGSLRAKNVRFSNRDFDDYRGNVSLQAGTFLEVSGARFQANVVSMEARTIILNNLSFADGSTVYLTSLLGVLAPNPNTGAPPEPGKVNFIQDVNYGSSPAETRIRTIPGPGIHIR